MENRCTYSNYRKKKETDLTNRTDRTWKCNLHAKRVFNTEPARKRPKLRRNSYFDGWTSMCAYKDVTARCSRRNRPFLQSCAYRTVTFVKVNPTRGFVRQEKMTPLWRPLPVFILICSAIQFARAMTYDFRRSVSVSEMPGDRDTTDIQRATKNIRHTFIHFTLF